MNRLLRIFQWAFFAVAFVSGLLYGLGFALHFFVDIRQLYLMQQQSLWTVLPGLSGTDGFLVFLIRWNFPVGLICQVSLLLGQLLLELRDVRTYQRYMIKDAKTQVLLTQEVEKGAFAFLDRIIPFVLLLAASVYGWIAQRPFHLLYARGELSRRLVWMPTLLRAGFSWSVVLLVSLLISFCVNRYFKGQMTLLFVKTNTAPEKKG